jgi:hypothetical protein
MYLLLIVAYRRYLPIRRVEHDVFNVVFAKKLENVELNAKTYVV